MVNKEKVTQNILTDFFFKKKSIESA